MIGYPIFKNMFVMPANQPWQQLQMNDDAASGIHFIVRRGGSRRGKKDDRNSLGSTNSMASLQQTPITRVNSVTSMLKRLFSKEDQRQGPIASQTDGGGSRFTISASNVSLNKPVTALGGSMKIANEVIEEVDEQATITSMANRRPENRPTAMSIFSQIPEPSDPVDVPRVPYRSTDSRLSTSAPSHWARPSDDNDDSSPTAKSLRTQNSFPNMQRPRLDSDVGPSLSAAGSQTLLDEVDGEEDPDIDFDRLRSTREQNRRDKYLQKLMARSVSAQQRAGSGELLDNEFILEELIMQTLANKQQDIINNSKDAT